MVPLLNPDGTTLASLESFDGSQRYFGSIMANCERALTFAVPYLLGQPYPKGVVLPDYNLDATAATRGRAGTSTGRARERRWRRSPGTAATPTPWTRPPGWRRHRGSAGARARARGPPRAAGFTVNDPFGSPRSGTAFVNATALSTPGECEYEDLPFPSIVINPKPGSRQPARRRAQQPRTRCRAPTLRPRSPRASVPGGGLLSAGLRARAADASCTATSPTRTRRATW